MIVNFTSRHFKATESLRKFAETEAGKLNKYYDGLIKCDVILSPVRPMSSIKTAEVIVTANSHHIFTSKVKTENYRLSIERAFVKMKGQLKKFKEKLKSNHSVKSPKRFQYR